MKYSRSRSLFALPAALLLGLAMLLLGCAEPQAASQQTSNARQANAAVPDSLEQATFAGGCFWCTEAAFQKLNGVTRAVSGFSGGTTPDPTYDAVAAGRTDYAEAVQVTYDPDQITYERLLDAYWRHMDPTDGEGQFADRGSQYRPVIFFHDARQQRLAREAKQRLAESGKFSEPIAVQIEPMERFYAAEAYHQNYFEKHPEEYERYYEGSGRGPFVRETWGGGTETTDAPSATQSGGVMQPASTTRGASGPAATQRTSSTTTAPPWSDFEKPSQAELREMLSPVAYRVTQEDGTERAFSSDLNDNERPGIYVDVVSGEPLYSSQDKFKSGTGWPSFTQPLEPQYVVEREDRSMGMTRMEVRSKLADSHLGHVFEDGPAPTGLRHCINGAALEFIPAGQLEARGYGMYAGAFE